VNVENVEHSFVIRLLKEAKDFIHLVVKRKISNSQYENNYQVPQSDQTFGINMASTKLNHINQAIQQTAATLIANYNNSNQISNPMSQMMNATTSLSSMKPSKITLNKKDARKDQFGVVLGCHLYIKEILVDSLAAHESSGLKKGDLVLKINDLSADHVSLYQANKIILKSKENKLNLVVKRPAQTNGPIFNSDSSDSPSDANNSFSQEDENDEKQQPAPQAPPRNTASRSSITTNGDNSSQFQQAFKPIKSTQTSENK
jgi:hypothetical protein